MKDRTSLEAPVSDTPTILSPHARKLKDHERDVALGKTTGEMHRISCPYCQVGAGLVTVTRKAGEAQLPIGEPVRCESCRRYFKIAARIKLYGQPIPTA